MGAYSLEGHVALVTGSSKGLGAAIVKELAAAGAKAQGGGGGGNGGCVGMRNI